MARYVKVLTSTGRWEYMRLIFTSRLHSVVRDATGHRYVITHTQEHARI